MAVDPDVAWLYNNSKKKSRNRLYAATDYGKQGVRPIVTDTGFVVPKGGIPFTKEPGYVSLNDLMMSHPPGSQWLVYTQALLAARGLISGDYAVGKWDEKTRDAVQDSITDARYNGVTLPEYLAPTPYEGKGLSQSGLTGSGSSGGSTAYNGPVTQTSTSVNLTSRGSARAYLTAALQVKLGRSPTKAEIDNFLRTLNQRERAKPTVTTTTITPEGHDTSTSSVTKGGVDPTAVAETFSEKHDKREADEYAAGRYMQIINGMLGMG